MSIDVHEQAALVVKNGKSRREVCKQFAHEGLKRASLQRFMKKAERFGDQITMGYHEGVLRILTSDMNKTRLGLWTRRSKFLSLLTNSIDCRLQKSGK